MSMTSTRSIQSLIDAGALRHIFSESGLHEYAIDPLRHTQPTGMGPQIMCYVLLIDDSTDERRYEIREESEYQGGRDLLITDDADEVVEWVTEQIGTT